MLCQLCKKRTANVQITQIVNNNKSVMYICHQCAKEKGQLDIGAALNLANFVSGIIGNASNAQTQVEEGEKCEVCGMSFGDVKKTGKLGCSNCYTIYGERLLPILKRIHGNTIHRGRYPERVAGEIMASRELENLKDSLSKAIELEEYEKAAVLRDRIKLTESGMEMHG